MADCVFCKIVEGKIPAAKMAENEQALAFADINPAAPVHALIIPKQHIATLNDAQDWVVMGPVFQLAAQVAREKGLDQTGWRVVINTGRDAHQLVLHIHLHVLGGRAMSWPPG